MMTLPTVRVSIGCSFAWTMRCATVTARSVGSSCFKASASSACFAALEPALEGGWQAAQRSMHGRPDAAGRRRCGVLVWLRQYRAAQPVDHPAGHHGGRAVVPASGRHRYRAGGQHGDRADLRRCRWACRWASVRPDRAGYRSDAGLRQDLGVPPDLYHRQGGAAGGRALRARILALSNMGGRRGLALGGGRASGHRWRAGPPDRPGGLPRMPQGYVLARRGNL